jgi:hypothetical protein
MSNLKPDMIGLDKGLNLQTAKIVAPKGSILDTLNYEQVDFQGQKRIDGFTRYDGSVLAALDEYAVIGIADSALYTPGSLLSVEDGLVGVVVSVDSGEDLIYVAVINETLLPEVGGNVYRNVDGVLEDEIGVVSVVMGVDAGDTPAIHYTNLLTFNQFLRNRVEELPGPVAGLHWFRDRLHAIAGVTYVSIEGTTPQIFPTDVLNVTDVSEGFSATVLDAFTLDNTRVVFLDTTNPAPWMVEGNIVERDAVQIGTIANGYEPFEVEDEIASIFEARTEQQVLTEDGPSGPYDFGWKFVALGWRVLFENGITLYGGLPAINQNVEGIGTQGPTPVTGNNGKLLNLNQGEDITGEKDQVEGWKSSQTPTSYSLLPSNLDEVDSNYIYADAYITWDGATGVVASPGITTNALPVRPATNTVEVDV